MAPLKTALAGGALVAALLAPTTASAASSKGCDGGGFTLRLADGSSLRPRTAPTAGSSRWSPSAATAPRRASLWDVASGGRMGAVTGEDAVEVAPPATTCTEDCQAQNQVRGEAVVLGFPFPVPAANRLNPRFPA